jgi:hypothetical protein
LHQLLQMWLVMSSSFHPQTDGQTERANRTLEEMIRHYVAHRQDNWSTLLLALEFAYNSSKHRVTGVSLLCVLKETKSSSRNYFYLWTPIYNMRQHAEAAATSIKLYNEVMARDSNDSRRDAEFAVGDQFYCRPSSSGRRPTLRGDISSP